MTNSKNLASRLREVLLNGRWIANTNFKDQLLNVTWEQAIQKTANLNTVAMLTYHINYYMAGLIKVFEGGTLDIKDKYSFDMPEIKSEDDWKKLVEEFLSNSEKFVNHVEQISDEKLNEPFVDVKYGNYQRNIEGIIEHCYYHLGQISLIRKMMQEKK